MRKALIIAGAVVAACLAWLVWPLSALYSLARAVEARDVPAVMEHVDAGAIRRSLTGQLSDAYIRVTGASARHNSLVVMVTTTIADTLVATIMSPESFTAMLHEGWVDSGRNERPRDAQGLSARTLGDPWQVFLNSEQSFDRYSVTFPVDKPTAQRFELRWHLKNWRWRLSEVMLPQELADRLARSLAKAQPPGG